jgi:hypothetical protein
MNKSLLTKSDHFGEIGCLYNCVRTCSVKSLNYSILARMTLPRMRVLFIHYPQLREKFKKHVFSYQDSHKNFVLSTISKIPYMKGVE